MDPRVYELWVTLVRVINRTPARLFGEDVVRRVRLVYDTEGEKRVEVYFADGHVETIEASPRPVEPMREEPDVSEVHPGENVLTGPVA